MLICARKIDELDFDALMEIYKEGNVENGAYFFPDETPERQYVLALESFCKYLADDFFRKEDAQYWILSNSGQYLSALRLEAYEDGLLLEALETRPDCRRQGYAKKLIQSVLLQIDAGTRIYSHVSKKNAASIATHLGCRFEQYLDCVIESDGTRNDNLITVVITA